jgi:hypothetical protein
MISFLYNESLFFIRSAFLFSEGLSHKSIAYFFIQAFRKHEKKQEGRISDLKPGFDTIGPFKIKLNFGANRPGETWWGGWNFDELVFFGSATISKQ